ncbi:MAG: type II toxin-antitoxin system Phd/YefM family antitoxin [Chloroflexota bacterium]
MDSVTIRELRNDVSRIVRRVGAGERLIVTSNGVPVAEIGPITRRAEQRTLEELIEAGAVIPPRTRAKPQPAQPVVFKGSRTTDEILDELRGRG